MTIKEKKTGKTFRVSGIKVVSDPHCDRTFFSPDEVEVLPEPGEKVVKGWIARDSVFDPMFGLGLKMHWKKPTRQLDSWSEDSILFNMSWDSYPEVTWNGEPKEVEICIR